MDDESVAKQIEEKCGLYRINIGIRITIPQTLEKRF